MRRSRVLAAAGAVVLTACAVPAIAGVVDRVVPHRVQPWDVNVCGPNHAPAHALLPITYPVPAAGAADVTILEVRPVGLADRAIHWRSWVVPGGRAAIPFTTGTDAPPVGWSERRTPGADAVATASRPLLPVLELWRDDGGAFALRGSLIRYRTSFGIVRQAVGPTEETLRPGGC